MDTTKNIKNSYHNNVTREQMINLIMNTKDNTNIKKEEQKTGKKERFENEEDTTIERKRHKSSKDQVRDIEKVNTLPIERDVNYYINKLLSKTDNCMEMVD